MISTRKFCGLILGFGACLAFGTPTFAEAADKPQVVLETTLGKITLELDPEKAPITVENFLKYVDDGFYDNLVFHRVIPGFMIQTGGMSDKIVEKHEGQRAPIKNESGNGLSNKRGTIAMARTNNPNSATSQFFINHADNANLDRAGGGYAVFGKVIDGLDVVDAIAKVETTTKGPHGDVPVKPIYIKSATRVKK
ncbi:peptidylprolyl isomerase [Paludisphaera borealis]|uniref:Peptidyl-prolyl cis-trans isomerase n=1 Tax=Paludisphaera borealis TaxID=1387353 RepID=A0A1U7CN54_9BACT|nr:peptidylprolyl isomerase [Paludisphaera borealis]APW60351.1 Peptidyl-prolyl cis-trans isomerase A [Paludisphaera borealis]